MPIETQRLILRRWNEDDAEELYKYACDEETGRLCGWNAHKSVEESREVIETVLSAPMDYAVVLKSTGLPVGAIGLHHPAASNVTVSEGELEVGYWIGSPYRGQGLIPEAVNAMLEMCFEQLGCPAVWCAYYDENIKSKRVQEKCGFIYSHTEHNKKNRIGDVHDEHYNRITREKWLKQKQK